MDAKPLVLIVDDDKNTRDGLGRALQAGCTVLLAENGERALDLLARNPVQVMISDMRMPGMDGLVLLQRALAHSPRLAVIMLTAYGSVDSAVEAMKRGAADFLQKPVELGELDQRIAKALRAARMEQENMVLKEQLNRKFGMESIIGESAPMHEVFDIIRQAAPTSATILIQGESGTGKELVAHAIHRLSTRAKGPFVAVHCAALAPTLLESELFGHEKGAFTGATDRRIGRFEMADGGTLFLDEISEVDPGIQTKLLRVLEERQFERVGGRATVEVDIRLITATNRDLKKRVEEGKFRDDLFFRLDVVSLTIPPLRERLSDLPLLCGTLLKEFAEKDNRPVREITPDALNLLMRYSWPGNVRELRNTIERMVVLARGDKLTVRDVPPAIRSAVDSRGLPAGLTLPAGGGGAVRSLDETEKIMILNALRKCGGNKSKAAEELGISRRTLHRKINQYKMDENAAPGLPGEGESHG
jgi:two-component system response regulator AtoC